MLDEPQTWRELLEQLANTPRERQRIASLLNINPLTITRWIRNTSNPRPDTLRQLLDVYPSHREQFLHLLRQEDFPGLGTTRFSPSADIPSAFYAQIFRTYKHTPRQIRTYSTCTSILQQMAAHLDPDQAGLDIVLAQCVPPSAGQCVRSLLSTFRRQTGILYPGPDQSLLFFGNESLAGNALMKGHTLVIHEKAPHSLPFFATVSDKVQSLMAEPILLDDRAIGVLSLMSPNPSFFTNNRQIIISRYLDVLPLIFPPEDFYPLKQLDLYPLPPPAEQQIVVQTFPQRIVRKMIEASQGQQIVRRPHMEKQVLQEIEEELIKKAFQQIPLVPSRGNEA